MPPVNIGSVVRLTAPRALRGTLAVVRREVDGGYEVEFRSPCGTPMHVVAAAKDLVPGQR